MAIRALITGITGQDGSYLAEFLLERGYQVFGLVRRTSTTNYNRLGAVQDDVTFIDGDLIDQSSLVEAMRVAQPDEVYNLAAQSFVATSWRQPSLTGDVTALGVNRILDAMRQIVPSAKFYQASSSEMFGKVQAVPQNEHTPFYPRSPYGVSKVYGHWTTINYRESYGMFAVSGILFNHESPRRGIEFVTKKITTHAAAIKMALIDKLYLGNPDAKRDWGFAGDYVRAMWMMLQQPEPEDFVISTGETHSIREFAELAFTHIGLDPDEHIVWNDPRYTRPAEVDLLIGDATKAKEKLGWQPQVTFKELAEMMVEADLKTLTDNPSSPLFLVKTR